MQEIAGLNFYIWQLQDFGDFSRNLGLTIYSRQEFSWQGKKIILAIVGESHFLLIENYLLELLACTNLPKVLPDSMILQFTANSQNLLNCHFSHVNRKLVYKLKTRIVSYCQAENSGINGEVLAQLNEEFPFCHQNEKFDCTTRVILAAENNQTLYLKTSHDYPYPDQKTVLTESVLIFKEPN